MTEYIQRQPYPTAYLPEMLQDYAKRVVESTQSTYEMVVPVMLSAMSAAVQGTADVRTPYGEVIPSSIFSFVIAKSGARKSSVLRKVSQGFDDFQRGKLPVNSMPGWEEQGYLRTHPYLLKDATNKGITDIFREGAYSFFYAFDEAGIILNKLDMSNLCDRFDGSTISEVSRKEGSIILHDRRVAMCMLTQDAMFEKFRNKKGHLLYQSGFMPRVLFSQALQDINFIDDNVSFQPFEDHNFNNRIKELMRGYAKSLDRSFQDRYQINFSNNATELWRKYKLHFRNLIQAETCGVDFADFLNRAGELICRVAAVLQYFVQPKQDVQIEAVQAAAHIVEWHLSEASRIFGEQSEEVRVEKEVVSLYNYIVKKLKNTKSTVVLKSELLRVGPLGTRNAENLEFALSKLQEMGRIFIFKKGPGTYVSLNTIIF